MKASSPATWQAHWRYLNVLPNRNPLRYTGPFSNSQSSAPHEYGAQPIPDFYWFVGNHIFTSGVVNQLNGVDQQWHVIPIEMRGSTPCTFQPDSNGRWWLPSAPSGTLDEVRHGIVFSDLAFPAARDVITSGSSFGRDMLE